MDGDDEGERALRTAVKRQSPGIGAGIRVQTALNPRLQPAKERSAKQQRSGRVQPALNPLQLYAESSPTLR